jgi:hypothetical protein
MKGENVMSDKKTVRGVFLNLEDSTYIITNGELNLFFSSSSRLGKFLLGYVENRMNYEKKVKKLMGETTFPYEYLADIDFYTQTENKGHFMLLNGEQITLDQFEQYIVKFIAERKELVYSVVSDPEEVCKIREVLEENGEKTETE